MQSVQWIGQKSLSRAVNLAFYFAREYIDALKDYQGDLLLAGINYDKKTKKHSCIIEKWNL